MKLLCTICARGGSKGVPGKNVRPLLGKPLIAWSVEQARSCGLFAEVAVSSDDEAILGAAERAGATILIRRPAALASDTAAKAPAIAHAVQAAEQAAGRVFETFVDLDATSPLRIEADIVGAVELLDSTSAESVITGSVARCSPYFSLAERRADGTVGLSKPMEGLVRRQDAPAAFDMNGSVFVWRRDPFLEAPRVFYPSTRLYEMPEERSRDIDTELDFRIVEMLMAERLAAAG